nr:GNAT family N-acetyltransferase [Prosthecomicrobium pneumaticum]
MIRPLDAPPAGDGEVRLFSPTDPRWYRAYATLASAPGPTIETLKLLLSLIAPEARGFVAYGRDRTPAAAALAVVCGEVAVFLNVVTDRARRRQGFGRAAMTAALGWSREAGARLAAIQVISDNAAAIGLYEGLGFGEHYRYHYRRPA